MSDLPATNAELAYGIAVGRRIREQNTRKGFTARTFSDSLVEKSTALLCMRVGDQKAEAMVAAEYELITTTPKIDHVDVVHDSEGWHVWPMWGGVQRPRGTGYLVYSERVAQRLRRAMEAGAVFYDATINRDVEGKTYVSASAHVLGRTVNTDLNRMGY